MLRNGKMFRNRSEPTCFQTAPRMLIIWSNCFVMASMQKFNLVIRRSVTSLNTVDDYQRIMFASKLARQYFMNNPNSLIDLVKLAIETVSASVLNQSVVCKRQFTPIYHDCFLRQLHLKQRKKWEASLEQSTSVLMGRSSLGHWTVDSGNMWTMLESIQLFKCGTTWLQKRSCDIHYPFP